MGFRVEGIARFFRSGAGLAVAASVAAIAIGGAGFWLGRMTASQPAAYDSDMESYTDEPAAAPQAGHPPQAGALVATATHRSRAHGDEPEGAAVIAAAVKTSGLRYVHRTNSDLRAEPSYASDVLKKEPKGAQVQLLALSDKWAQVQDGAVKGWMRSSVLKDTPPDADTGRKKKSDTGN